MVRHGGCALKVIIAPRKVRLRALILLTDILGGYVMRFRVHDRSQFNYKTELQQEYRNKFRV
jgi:hypothetical protein